jgi:hypothetical protein
MSFCSACGSELRQPSSFCSKCGVRVVGELTPLDAEPTNPPITTNLLDDVVNEIPPTSIDQTSSTTQKFFADQSEPSKKNNKSSRIGLMTLIGLLSISAIGFMVFTHQKNASSKSAAVSAERYGDGIALGKQTLHVRATGNLRDGPTTSGTKITGTKPRGSIVTGEVVIGTDGSSRWLKLDENGRYLSAGILSTVAGPQLTSMIEQEFYPTEDLVLGDAPDGRATVTRTVVAGEKIWLVGKTASNNTEAVITGSGIKVGYFKSAVDLEAEATAAIAQVTAIAAAANAAKADANQTSGAEITTLSVRPTVGDIYWVCEPNASNIKEARVAMEYNQFLDKETPTGGRYTGRIGPGCCTMDCNKSEAESDAKEAEELRNGVVRQGTRGGCGCIAQLSSQKFKKVSGGWQALEGGSADYTFLPGEIIGQ